MDYKCPCYTQCCATCHHYQGPRRREPGVTYQGLWGYVICPDNMYCKTCKKNEWSQPNRGGCSQYEIWDRLHDEIH